MAFSSKYGKIDIPKVGLDEPVFILRAQDKLAQPTIEIYRLLAASHGSPITETLQREINQFDAWEGPRKLPD